MNVIATRPLIKKYIPPADATSQFQQVAKKLTEVKQTKGRDNFAQNILFYLLSEWWAARYPHKYLLREPFAEFKRTALSSTNKRIILELAMILKGSDLLEAGYLVGNLYTNLISQEIRTKNGAFFTPPNLSSRLMDMAVDSGVDFRTARVLDHSCGGGAFLAPVALRIISALEINNPRAILRHISDHIRGIEIDPFSAWISQVFLDAVVGKYCIKSGHRLPVLITVADTLQVEGITGQFDLVIGNPPYGKIKLTDQIKSRFTESLYGHVNLYGLFTHLAFDYVSPNGVVALLKPTGFLGGEYFKNLRSFILARSRPTIIDFVHARKGVFDSVLQETLLVTYKLDANNTIKTTVNELNTPSAKEHIIHKLGNYRLAATGSAPWILPRTIEQKQLLESATRFTSNLGEWGYKVKTGPLVWNRKKDQLTNNKGDKTVPLIWAESVLSSGQFKWKADLRDHLPFFRLSDKDAWLQTTTSCILVQRTTAKEQRKRIISCVMPASFIKKHKAVVIENHLNLIIPNCEKPRVELEELNAFLNSDLADGLFRCISGSVAVSAYELESIPLPAPNELGNLVRINL